MINLIPLQEKKKIQKDFYLRFTIVAFIVLGLGIFISLILLTPSLFYSSIQKNLIKTQVENLKNNNVIGVRSEYASVISDLNSKLGIINTSKDNKFVISESIIKQTVLSKTSGIKITEINYFSDIEKGKILELRGEALTRENLLFYKNKLSENPNFKEIDLPISNFIKSNNIQFNLIIHLI